MQRKKRGSSLPSSLKDTDPQTPVNRLWRTALRCLAPLRAAHDSHFPALLPATEETVFAIAL
jgi:hypothetical protein